MPEPPPLPSPRRGDASALLVLCLLLAACTGDRPVPAEPGPGDTAGGGDGRPAAAVTPLPVVAEEHRLHGDQVHRYRIDAEAGELLRVEAEQLGVDVVLRLLDPAGEAMILVDTSSPTGCEGVESLLAATGRSGPHLLEVSAFKPAKADGSYTVRLAERRPAGPEDRRRAAAEASFAAGAALAWKEGDQERSAALHRFAEAAESFAALGDRRRQADALRDRCQLLERMAELHQARAECLRARELYRDLGRSWERGVVASTLGVIFFRLDDFLDAIPWYEEALPLRREAHDLAGEANTLEGLGRCYQELDAVHEALTAFGDALAIWHRLRDTAREATTRHNRAVLYQRLGRQEEALRELERLLELDAGDDNPERQVLSLVAVGKIYGERGEVERAIGVLEEALSLSRKYRYADGICLALAVLGTNHARAGDPERARQRFDEALYLAQRDRHRVHEAAVHNNIGQLSIRQERFGEALDSFRRALDLALATGDWQIQALALLGTARAERALGRPLVAWERIRRGIETIEDRRSRMQRTDLKIHYMASQQSYYDFAVDLLMQLDGEEPGAGWAARALEVCERGRARGLVGLLNAIGADLGRALGPGVEERLLRSRQELDAADKARRRALSGDATEEGELRRVEARLHDALEAYRNLLAEIRVSSPGFSSLTEPEALSAEALQRTLDDDTLLLEYKLGEESSHLWAVSRHTLEGYELPSREQLETLAQGAYDVLRERPVRRSLGAESRRLGRLAEALLCPVRQRLGERRLLVVADGPLHFVPFAALPIPSCGDPGAPAGDGDRPLLISRHEIVSMPSATALAVLRRRRPLVPAARKALAVIADPVFTADDPRVGATGRSEAAGDGGGRYPRLVSSRAEARALAALLPAGETEMLLDFAASRERLLSLDLDRFRALHFATHGEIDGDRPDLSRLVLSQVDPSGRPLPGGDLKAHEIYDLSLSADLVVLSSCSSAGREIRGEGLVGFTQGFFYAGARHLVVSLWSVDDQATARLMETLYRRHLVAGDSPAAALRAAQLTVAAEPRWRSPYYWAGFIAQGDWR